MFEVKKIMNKPICVRADTPIDEAIETLVENNISGMPVVDPAGRLIGMITEKDLLTLMCCEEIDSKVGDFMTTEPISFEAEEDIVAICECLINNNFRRVPIVSKGKLVGIISRRDIISYILEPVGP